jgi:hypothetical protein
MNTTKPNNLPIEPWNGKLMLVLPVSNTRVKKMGIFKCKYLVNNIDEVKEFIRENNKLAVKEFGEGIFGKKPGHSKLTLTWGEACAVWIYREDLKYFVEGDQPDFDMNLLDKP